jgi:hypothetical protein
MVKRPPPSWHNKSFTMKGKIEVRIFGGTQITTTANMRLAKVAVQWLIKHLCLLSSSALRNPLFRQALTVVYNDKPKS